MWTGHERLTIRDVEDDDATDEQSDNLYSVPHRLELGRHRRIEAHVADNYCGERVDDAIGDRTACYISKPLRLNGTLGGESTYAAKTLMKRRMLLGSQKPILTCPLSKFLFLIPV